MCAANASLKNICHSLTRTRLISPVDTQNRLIIFIICFYNIISINVHNVSFKEEGMIVLSYIFIHIAFGLILMNFQALLQRISFYFLFVGWVFSAYI
jgi:hypothetical protein